MLMTIYNDKDKSDSPLCDLFTEIHKLLLMIFIKQIRAKEMKESGSQLSLENTA